MSWPRLMPAQMQNAASYVVAADLRLLGGGFLRRHAAELVQWQARDKKAKRRRLAKPDIAILNILGLFRGLRDGVDGCGVQASAAEWARELGCCVRAVGYAFARLRAAGLIQRRPRLVAVKWSSAPSKKALRAAAAADGPAPAPVERSRADVYAVAYLTTKGAVWLERRRKGTRRLVVQGSGKAARVLTAAGMFATLLRTFGEKLRAVAKRVSTLEKTCRPTASLLSEETKTKKSGVPLRGTPRIRGVSRRTRAQSNPGADPPVAGKGVDLPKLEQLFHEGALTPWSAWPDVWPTLKNFEPRTSWHWYLIRLCERWVEYFEIRFNETQSRQPNLRERPRVEPQRWSR